MKAIKLIWLSDRTHLRKYGRLIFNDTYYAMKLGPVASKTKDLCDYSSPYLEDIEKEVRDQFIQPHHKNLSYKSLQSSVDNSVFSETEINIMEEVYASFGGFSEFQLANDITHKFPEWKKHKERIKNQKNARVEIAYTDFFKNPDEKDLTDKLPGNHLELSRLIFEENQSEHY